MPVSESITMIAGPHPPRAVNEKGCFTSPREGGHILAAEVQSAIGEETVRLLPPLPRRCSDRHIAHDIDTSVISTAAIRLPSAAPFWNAAMVSKFR